MDYFTTQLNFPKIEYPFGYEWLYHEQEQPPFGNLILEVPPLHSFCDPNLPPLSHHHDQLTDFQDFDDFCGGFLFDNATPSTVYSEAAMVDEKPRADDVVSFDQNATELSRVVEIREIYSNLDKRFEEENAKVGRKKCVGLELKDVQKYFDVPIKEAAKELGIGVTRLKKRCRELGIMRWPHRKFKSLDHLISNVKKMGLSRGEIMMLEEQKRLLEKTPNLELTMKAKKLRQACFKANYKNKMSLAFGQRA